MQSFKDKSGKTWSFDLNIASWRRVKSETGIDLADLTPSDGKTMLDKLADPVTLMEVLYVLCVPAADRHDIKGEDFMSGMSMQTVESAADALLEEIANFSLPATRNLLMRLLKSSKKFVEKRNEQLEQALASQEMESSLNLILSEVYASSPASLEQTQPPSASGN